VTHKYSSFLRTKRIGNKVERSTLLPICCQFNKVDRVEFNFVASVYRA